MQQPTRRTVTVAVLLLSLLFGTWMAARTASAQDYAPTPVPGGGNIPIACGGSTVSRPPATIVIPPGFGCGGSYSLVYTPLGSVDCPPPVGCQIYAPFNVEVYLGIDRVVPADFGSPAVICMHYPNSLADAMGGPENLIIAYYDPGAGQWLPISNIVVDPGAGQVCGEISVLGDLACGFALTCAFGPEGVPVTGANRSADAGTAPLWAALTAAAVLGCATAIRRRRAVRPE